MNTKMHELLIVLIAAILGAYVITFLTRMREGQSVGKAQVAPGNDLTDESLVGRRSRGSKDAGDATASY